MERETLGFLSLAESTQRLLRFYKAEEIDFEEFASNLLIVLVGYDCDACHEALAAVPADLLQKFLRYVTEYLHSVDFMPSPRVFMVDRRSPQAVEAKRVELRPVYVELLSNVQKIASND